MKKQQVCLLTILLSVFLFANCNNDNNVYYVSLVTAVEKDNKLLFIKNDSLLLNPTNYNTGFDVGQRILIKYNIENTYEINSPHKYDIYIVDFDIILTKDVIDLTTENQAMVGNNAFWDIYGIGSSGGFLNVNIGFLYNYIPHTINLVSNTISPSVDTPELVHLELRQNANGPNSGYILSKLVSFNIQKYMDIAKAAKVETLTLKVKIIFPQNNVKTFTVVFNTGSPNIGIDKYTITDTGNNRNETVN